MLNQLPNGNWIELSMVWGLRYLEPHKSKRHGREGHRVVVLLPEGDAEFVYFESAEMAQNWRDATAERINGDRDGGDGDEDVNLGGLTSWGLAELAEDGCEEAVGILKERAKKAGIIAELVEAASEDGRWVALADFIEGKPNENEVAELDAELNAGTEQAGGKPMSTLDRARMATAQSCDRNDIESVRRALHSLRNSSNPLLEPLTVELEAHLRELEDGEKLSGGRGAE